MNVPRQVSNVLSKGSKSSKKFDGRSHKTTSSKSANNRRNIMDTDQDDQTDNRQDESDDLHSSTNLEDDSDCSFPMFHNRERLF